MTTANDEWRNDLGRLREWEVELQRRTEAYLEAQALVEQAVARLDEVGKYLGRNDHGGNGMWNRVIDAVWHAQYIMDRDKTICDPPSKTYLENMAAFGRPR